MVLIVGIFRGPISLSIFINLTYIRIFFIVIPIWRRSLFHLLILGYIIVVISNCKVIWVVAFILLLIACAFWADR